MTQVHVFQTFPFLDQSRRAFVSMRDYVHNVLPGIQVASPQHLDRDAESELEHEIDNEDIRVVRGDGVETATGRKRASESFIHQLVVTQSQEDTGDEGASSSDELPSWGKAAATPLIRSRRSSTASMEQVEPERSKLNVIPSPPILRRIQSATHALFDQEPVPETRPMKRNRRKTSTSDSHSSANRLMLPNLSMSPVNGLSPVTSPFIRRSRSTASHPDLTSMVEQFNSSGPANETTVYRPRLKARQSGYFYV